MNKLKLVLAFFFVILSSKESFSQVKKHSKNLSQKVVAKDSVSLANFLKELDKSPVTKATLFNKATGKPNYKTSVVYYIHDRAILVPAKNDL